MLLGTALILPALAVLTGASPTSLEYRATSSLNWIACVSPAPTNFQCAKLTAPLYYDDPTGPNIDLNVVKIPAKNQSMRVGSWIFQEGGPGNPTAMDVIPLDNAAGWARIQEIYDIVVLDPRGVGINYPLLCDPEQVNKLTASTQDFPDSEEKWNQYRDGWGTLGEGCKQLTQQTYGVDIWSTFDTRTSAHDLETLRVALNEGGINYYGLSWGAQRGQQYVDLFPQNIRSMVLDGIAGHTLPLEDIAVSTNVGFGKAMDDFFQWASKNATSAMQGTDAKTATQALLDQVAQQPISPAACQNGTCAPTITKWSMLSIVGGLMENQANYPLLAKGFTQAIQGNFTLWETTFTNTSSGSSNSYMLGCMDFYTNETYQEWADLRRAEIAFVGYDYLSPTMPDARYMKCPKWPAPVVNPPKPFNITNTSAPILLVNSLFDPATPYDGAVHVQRQIPGSDLLTRNGAGHSSLYVVRDGEAQDLIVDYFVSGKLPAPGTVVDS